MKARRPDCWPTRVRDRFKERHPLLPPGFRVEKPANCRCSMAQSRVRSSGESNPAPRLCRPHPSRRERTDGAPGEGVEPPMSRLTAGRLATWLPWKGSRRARLPSYSVFKDRRPAAPSSCKPSLRIERGPSRYGLGAPPWSYPGSPERGTRTVEPESPLPLPKDKRPDSRGNPAVALALASDQLPGSGLSGQALGSRRRTGAPGKPPKRPAACGWIGFNMSRLLGLKRPRGEDGVPRES